MNRTKSTPIGLQLKWLSEFHGPNPYAEFAVVVGKLTADELPEMAQMKSAVADLWVYSGMHPTQGADPLKGCEGDALLWLGHAAVAWAMGALNEVRGFVQHAAAVREGDSVHVSLGFHHAQLSRDALQLALRSLVQSIKGGLVRTELRAELKQLWQSCKRHHPDYQARILMVGAREMDVPFLPFLPGSKYWQFGWGAKGRVFMESSSNQDGTLGQQWQKSKVTAKAVMSTLGLPTPKHVLALREDQVQEAVERVGYPCVLKPLDSGGGKGVTANVRTLSDAIKAFRVAHHQKQGPVLVEAHVQGEDHRLMVIDGQFVAAIRREPSFVVGDGQKSVAALVAELNANRSTNMVRSRYLRIIAKDEVLDRHLATQSLTLHDVLANGQRVTLRSNANLSTGGLCTDVTAHCHPQVRAMAVLLAKNVGLATIGIDYLTTDITQSPEKTGGAFIEMNTTPGLGACVAAGWSEASIARCVLGEAVGRISVDLTVLSPSSLLEWEGGFVIRAANDGVAVIWGHRLYLEGLVMSFHPSKPWDAVYAGLKNKQIQHLHVVCSVDVFTQFGCPIDRVRELRVELKEDGMPVIENHWNSISKNLSAKILFFSEKELPSCFIKSL
jgi:cyanophycin synthetase